MSYRYRVLHVADPHFGNCHFQGSATEVGELHAKEMCDVLERNQLLQRPLDAIVFSGDFTFGCSSDGFRAAEVFIETMAKTRTRQNQPVVPPGNILVIPGNHDIDLGKPVVIGKDPNRQISIPAPQLESEKEFRSFLAVIEKHVGQASHCLSMVLNVEQQGERRLLIIGLNSSRVERWDARGWGYIGMDQIYEVASELNNPAVFNAEKGDVLLAVIHHNMLPIWDLGLETLNMVPGKRTFSFTMDTGSTLGFLADLGVGVLLHGHTHVQSAKSVEGYGSNPVLRSLPTLILGAGSMGLRTRRGDKNPPPHHFQLIEIETDTTSDPPSDPVLTYQDLSALFCVPGKTRTWSLTPSSQPYLLPSWDPDRVQEVLRAKSFESERCRRDSDTKESWCVLRIKILSPADWPQALLEIQQRVLSLQKELAIDPLATPNEIANAVEQLFITPPTDREICIWSLEEYLIKHMQELQSQFLAGSAS